MLKVGIVGGGASIGGSCTIINDEVVLDCGLNPQFLGEDEETIENGRKQALALQKKVPRLDSPLLEKARYLILSHPHLDHVGAVVLLLKKYDIEAVWATEIAQELTIKLLEDGFRIAERKGEPFLFERGDIRLLKELFRTVDYGDTVNLNSLEIETPSSGHTDGGVSLKITDGNKKGFITSDICFRKRPFIPPAPIIEEKMDILLMESTYAGTGPVDIQREQFRFIKALEKSIEEGKKVLLPCFSMGKSQWLFWFIKRSLEHVPDLPLYIDGASKDVLETLDKYYHYNEDLDSHFVGGRKGREHIIQGPGPAIIISSSGMLIGGRANEYAKHFLPRRDAAIFFTGYLDPKSTGYEIARALPYDQVRIDNQSCGVCCNVARFHFSSHASQTELADMMIRMDPGLTVLTHGYERNMKTLVDKARHRGFDGKVEIGYESKTFIV